MSEDKHSWDRVPAWDGDRRQWKRYLRDVELHLETENLDVDCSHGARLTSRLTGSAKKYAETIELDQTRRSTGADKDTREGMIACVKHLLKSLKRPMGMEEVNKELQRRPGQPMAECVNVLEKAVLLRSLERAMEVEDATEKGQVQEFFYKKLQRRPGQPMAVWDNVFERADMKAEGLNVELKNMGWHLFEK